MTLPYNSGLLQTVVADRGDHTTILLRSLTVLRNRPDLPERRQRPSAPRGIAGILV